MEAPPPAPDPPLLVPDGSICWVRTEIQKGSDLVNGAAWIAEFERRITNVQKQFAAATSTPGRRLLRQTASEGDQPQFWNKASDAALPIRNEVLKSMASDTACKPPGLPIRLVTGQEVIFWFNLGPPEAAPRDKVFVTDARCPHQGVCLLEGELRDIEDVAGIRHGMVRCPRHNKTFDLRSGQSPGNSEVLRAYPCRFERGYWYVGIDESEAGQYAAQASTVAAASDDVDMQVEEPDQKRARVINEVIVATPGLGRPRILAYSATLG